VSTWDFQEQCLGLSEGLQVLQLQRGKYSFLVRCCEKTLHDIVPKQLATATNPVSVNLPAGLAYDKICGSFTQAAKRAPYISIRAINGQRTTYLALTAVNNAKDHLVALREDPGTSLR